MLWGWLVANISKPMLKEYTKIDFMEKVYLIYKNNILINNNYRKPDHRSFRMFFTEGVSSCN